MQLRSLLARSARLYTSTLFCIREFAYIEYTSLEIYAQWNLLMHLHASWSAPQRTSNATIESGHESSIQGQPANQGCIRVHDRCMCGIPWNLNITGMPMAVQHDLYMFPREKTFQTSALTRIFLSKCRRGRLVCLQTRKTPTWQAGVFRVMPTNADVAGWRY